MSSQKSVVDQAKLRQMMAKLKQQPGTASAASGNNAKLKKYKLSAREMALLEEEKRRKAEKKKASASAAAPPLPKDFFERKPTKSILKNSSTSQQQYSVPSTPSAVETTQINAAHSGIKRSAEKNVDAVEAVEKKRKLEENAAAPAASQDVDMSDVENPGASDAAIPEGFFDDPVKDAKARNIEYKDPADEEWARFQKEITQELDTAQEIVTEDQEEATTGRQLEEIEEQMRAWNRVSQMEKRLDSVEGSVDAKKKTKASAMDEGSDSDSSYDAEFDELSNLSNWRKKC